MIRFLFILALVSPAAALAAAPGDAASGRVLAGQVCAACHAADGNSPLPINPVLAGQHPEYLYKQLVNFKSGARQNAVMAGMVAGLSDDDMRNLAAFYATQEPRAAAAGDKDLVAKGQALYRGGRADGAVAACSGCHSPNGAGIPIQYPRLAGQHAEYTSTQLKAFRAGERGNDPNQMMQMIASRLSDKEIAALAEYISGLR
jgi:cytochrome c553